MKIIIDMQGLQSKASGNRGVGRYTDSLVKSLLKINKEHEIFLALNGALDSSIEKIKSEFGKLIPLDNIIVWQNFIDTSANTSPDDVNIEAAEIIREMFFESYAPDVIFSTNLQEGLFEPAVTSVKRIANSQALFISTLHDLVPFYYKEKYLSNLTTNKWYFSKIEYAIKSDVILTVSYSSKQDIVKFLGINPEKIIVIENGYDESHYNNSPIDNSLKQEILSKYKIHDPFVFYVGGNDPHKNIENLIYAFASDSMINERSKLVLGGSHFVNDRKVLELIYRFNLSKKVILPGFIEESHLPVLYKSCLCFVFPSTHEGFGLPALEAMASGAPTIGSNSSSIKEIICNPDALFDPSDHSDIASLIKKTISNRKFAENLIKNGLIQARNYSWEKSASKLLALLETLKLNIPKSNLSRSNFIEKTVEQISGLDLQKKQESLFKISQSIAESFEEPRKSKLYLDLSVVIVHDDKSGIQRVARAISKSLLDLKNNLFDVEIVYTNENDSRFFRSFIFDSQTACVEKKSELSSEDQEVTFNKNDILIFLDLYPSAVISHQKLLRHLRNKGVSVYHVVYDILPILKPETFWPELCKEFNLWAQSVSSSDGALCISRSVANEFKAYIEEYGNKRSTQFNIGWFHLGADIKNSIPSVGGLDSNALSILRKLKDKKTFLMVGTVEPRKGHRQTLKAFEMLWEEKLAINLVIVGRLGWGMGDFEKYLVNHPQLENQLYWLKGISDEYLEKVYEVSSCLIAASEGEGYGLPLIEAAQYKVPLILRDIPVFREVVGLNGYYFKNNTLPETISHSIKNWIDLYSKRKHPLSENICYLTWKESAQRLLNVIIKKEWEFKVDCKNSLTPGFSYNHNSDRLNFFAFSNAEQHHRWSDGKESSISFYWAELDNARQARLILGTLGSQKIFIHFNDVIVFENTLCGETEIVLEIKLINFGLNVLKFYLPDAQQPNERDTRLLAIKFYELELLETLKPIHFFKVHDFSSRNLNFRNFNGSENNFKWSQGKSAAIEFFWSGKEDYVKIRLLLKTMSFQNITIIFNGFKVFQSNINGDRVELMLDINNIKFGFNRIDFDLPDARRPNDTDERILAIAFYCLEVLPS